MDNILRFLIILISLYCITADKHTVNLELLDDVPFTRYFINPSNENSVTVILQNNHILEIQSDTHNGRTTCEADEENVGLTCHINMKLYLSINLWRSGFILRQACKYNKLNRAYSCPLISKESNKIAAYIHILDVLNSEDLVQANTLYEIRMYRN